MLTKNLIFRTYLSSLQLMLCGVAAVAAIFFSLVYHASKGSIFQNLFIFTAADVVRCGGWGCNFFSLVYHASKGSIFQNLFIFTAANVVPCDGRKKFPVLHYNADYIFWSFGIIGFIFGYFENRILLKPVLGYVASVAHLSLVLRKPAFGVSDQVWHKPGCTATEDS